MSKKAIAKKNKRNNKATATDHILRLFEIAKSDPDSIISKNSIKLAEKYSTRFKAPIPRELKRSYCKGCHHLFNASNSIKRITKGIITITCKECETQKRIKFKTIK